MNEIQQLATQIETNPDDLEAWQRLSQLVDDPKKKKDCLNQITRIDNKNRGFDEIVPCENCGAWMRIYEDHLQHQKGAACRSCNVHKILETYEQGETSTSDVIKVWWAIAAIIGGNLLPVIGVLFFNWNVASIVILYWRENLVIGFFAILKMLSVKTSVGNKIGTVLFFCFHYGGFWFIHGFFVMAVFGSNISDVAGLSDITSWSDAVNWLIAHLPWILWQRLWPILGLFITHGISFLQNRKEYPYGPLEKFMLQPYPRIIPIHLLLFFAGSVIQGSGNAFSALIFLIVLKTLLELLPVTFQVLANRTKA